MSQENEYKSMKRTGCCKLRIELADQPNRTKNEIC